ncbi:Crp/Fnr family transcriptional regulator [Haliovirga abyssi]|uniref:Crp/Fnr family transcriptional regulator n=1 Tax=Haliovirga abyssi TaxID=2996794 RepID=A0AAU9D1H7_9FUSO|nr:cyclic nucleotide-binding domain-containing protein [Haliovirga abyssi]BDU49841.1 Crp/Fnr family transcriptional regulator [Haliovirga abyssi]
MLDNPKLFEKFGKDYKAGEIIFCEYETGEELYFIISGKVRISKITQDEEKVVAYLKDGEFFGEMAIFENKVRTATVITEEPTKVLELKKNDFLKLMSSAPDIVVQLVKSLSIRYIKTRNQLNSLLETNLEKKVLKYFYQQYLNVKSRSLNLNIKEVKSILNIKEKDLNKLLLGYKKKGLLKIVDDSILIGDIGWVELKLK